MNPFPTGWFSFLVFGCFRFSTQNTMDWTLWKHSNVGFAWGVLDDGSVPVTDAALDGDVIEKKWCLLWKSSCQRMTLLRFDFHLHLWMKCQIIYLFAWFCTFPTFSYLLSPFRMILVKTEEWMSNDTMIHVNQWTFPAKMSHGASQRGALDGIGKRPNCAMSTLPLVNRTPCSRMPVDFSWLSPGAFWGR